MDCNCGGQTKTLYRVNPEDRTFKVRAEQCKACGREVRWLVANDEPQEITGDILQ